MYAQDYDEHAPQRHQRPCRSGAGGRLVYYSAFPANATPKSFDVTQGSLYPYIHNAQVYVCPSDTQGKTSGNSYAINSCALTFGAASGG